MNVQTGYTAWGDEVHYIKMSKSKGRKYWADLGYTQSRNPVYMQKDNKFVHYNSIMKAWILG